MSNRYRYHQQDHMTTQPVAIFVPVYSDDYNNGASNCDVVMYRKEYI